MIEGLSLLGPLICPTSWLASLVEWVDGEPAKRAMLVQPMTPAKSDKGKSLPGSSVKRSSQPKPISNYWKDPERKKEDEESQRQEEEKHCRKSSGAPVLSLAEHKELVSSLTSKTASSWVSQLAGHPSRSVAIAPNIRKHRDKMRRPSPNAFDSSDDDPLSDREWEPKAKSRKRDHTSPVAIVVLDDDEPLSDSKHKTPVKKSQTYTTGEQDALDRLLLQLKSDGHGCQYSKETVGLTKYCNEKVPDL